MPEAVEIRDLPAEGAGALIACVRRCYGESYPEADFYDEAALAALLGDGRLHSKAAFTAGGRIVGHLGTRFRVAGDIVAETVGGFVDPDHRGQGLLRALGRAMFQVYRQSGLTGIWLFSTGAHVRTQKQILSAGGCPTGLLLGHVPGGTEYRGIDHAFGDARIASVVFHQPFSPAPPLRVYYPARHAELARGIYRGLGLQRELATPGPTAAPLSGGHAHDRKRGVSRLAFGRCAEGDVLPLGVLPLDALLEEARAAGAPVTYADLPLADPGTPVLAEQLGACGFFFGAVLPGSAASETLRLQRLVGARVAPERMALASRELSDLRAFVQAERERVEEP